MIKRVADIIMDILVEKGITECFGVVGGGAMHLDNALALNDRIRKIFNHHEQASAMAAEAYARISGRMAAVCVTSGPGATNTMTGVMGCWQDSLPMLVLSGQVRYAISVPECGLQLRYRGIQEFNVIPAARTMTKYAVMITDPLEIRRELCKAIDIAMNGRRGPVWLDIPLDIQSANVDTDDLYPEDRKLPVPEPSDPEIDEMLIRLREAKRPCILAGNGIANSHSIDAFRSFAEKTGIPVIAACIAADAMYREHENYFGLSGSIGPRAGNFIVQNADVILSLGCSLGFKMTGFAQEKFAPNAYIISVDADRNELIKPGVRTDRVILSDLPAFFDKCLKKDIAVSVSPEWAGYCRKLKKRFSVFEPAQGLPEDERVCAYRFWEEYEKYEPSDSITILGNNTANSAKLQIGIRKADQRLVANNNCGSMGADLPEAIGAAIASGKTVVCVTGDGSIMMNLQELQTIRQNHLPVKVIVFSNDGYNAIRQTSKNFFGGVCIGCTADTGVSFPSFKDVAGTFGMKYLKCENNGQLGEALSAFFADEENVLLEVLQRLDDPVTPKVMSRMNEDGTFSTPSLEDMAPFISQEEHDSLMFW